MRLQKQCFLAVSQFLNLAKEELELKRDTIQQQKEIDEDYKKTMTTLAGSMENLSKSITEGFWSLRSMLPPVHARPAQHQYLNLIQQGSAFGQQLYESNIVTYMCSML